MKEGDIIAFKANWGVIGRVIHRVVEIKGDKFFAQGDNMLNRDEGYRTIEDIEGILESVVRDGPTYGALMQARYWVTGW